MSLYDFKRAVELVKSDEPFYALVMAAMMRADTDNIERLKYSFPHIHDELAARYHAPGGVVSEYDGDIDKDAL